MLSAAAALLALVIGAAGIAHLLAPVAPPPGELKGLRRRQKELERRRSEGRARIAELGAWVEDIRSLQARMRAVDASLYRTRLERLDAGIGLLRRQLELEEVLQTEYARAAAILDVECETLRVAGRLEDRLVEDVTLRLAELEAVREDTRELELLLQAAEEVEALLRDGSA